MPASCMLDGCGTRALSALVVGHAVSGLQIMIYVRKGRGTLTADTIRDGCVTSFWGEEGERTLSHLPVRWALGNALCLGVSPLHSEGSRYVARLTRKVHVFFPWYEPRGCTRQKGGEFIFCAVEPFYTHLYCQPLAPMACGKFVRSRT